MYANPRITTLDSSRFPKPPKDWTYTNFDGPDSLTGDPKHFPVLLFGPYTYTVLNNIHNPTIPVMKIVGWDMHGNFVKDLDKKWAQYLWKITFDPASQTVSFFGQWSNFVSATLDELAIRPSVDHIPTSLGPVLPYTLAYGDADPNKFPVIKCGTYTFWPVTYKDGRDSLSVVVTKEDNAIQQIIDCPGTQLIRDIEVDDNTRTITLNGWDGSKAFFDYELAMASFYIDHTITKDDIQLFAKAFNVSISLDDATTLAKAMPHINSALCSRMDDMPSTFIVWWSYQEPFAVGPFLAGYIGALGGFLVRGACGVAPGFDECSAVTKDIGPIIDDLSWNIGDYTLSSREKESSAVAYKDGFPCGPFIANSGGIRYIWKLPFLRYGDANLFYCGAVASYSATSPLQAYIPAHGEIDTFPRNPDHAPATLRNGIQVTKYTFVIILTTVSERLYYQMRIIHEDFDPNTWPTAKRITRAQLSSGYHFWTLMGHWPATIYAGGSLFVDITNQRILGIDTRPVHFYPDLRDKEQAMNQATVGFLTKLGYPTSDILTNADVLGYFQENPIVN